MFSINKELKPMKGAVNECVYIVFLYGYISCIMLYLWFMVIVIGYEPYAGDDSI